MTVLPYSETPGLSRITGTKLKLLCLRTNPRNLKSSSSSIFEENSDLYFFKFGLVVMMYWMVVLNNKIWYFLHYFSITTLHKHIQKKKKISNLEMVRNGQICLLLVVCYCVWNWLLSPSMCWQKAGKKGTWWKISHFCTCPTGTNQNRRENNVIFLSQGCIVHVFEMWGSFLLMWNENVAKTGSQIN